MKLEQLLQTTPETLAVEQHAALKEHVIKVLESTLNAVRDEYYTAVSNFAQFSPAGNGMVCDISPLLPCIICDVMERLIELKKIAKKKIDEKQYRLICRI